MVWQTIAEMMVNAKRRLQQNIANTIDIGVLPTSSVQSSGEEQMATHQRTLRKKKKIVKAASALFSRHGFKDTTLDAIAMKAQMGKASLYYYFPDGKESIFSTVVQGEAEKAFAEIREVISEQPTPALQLEAYLKHRIRIFHENMGKHRVSEQTRDELLSEAELEMGSYLLAERMLIENFLREGVRCGDFRPMDDVIVARLIQASIRAVTRDSQSRLLGDGFEAEQEAFLHFVMGALRP